MWLLDPQSSYECIILSGTLSRDLTRQSNFSFTVEERESTCDVWPAHAVSWVNKPGSGWRGETRELTPEVRSSRPKTQCDEPVGCSEGPTSNSYIGGLFTVSISVDGWAEGAGAGTLRAPMEASSCHFNPKLAPLKIFRSWRSNTHGRETGWAPNPVLLVCAVCRTT